MVEASVQASEHGTAHAVCILTPDGLRRKAGLVEIWKVAVRGLNVGGGEHGGVGGKRPADEQASAALPECARVHGTAHLKGGSGAEGAKVNGTAEAVGPVQGRGRPVHHLNGAEEDSGEEGEVQVPDLRVRNALAVQQEGRLGGAAASKGRSSEASLAIPSHVQAGTGFKGRSDGRSSGASEGR
jgi:hypothetical protein